MERNQTMTKLRVTYSKNADAAYLYLDPNTRIGRVKKTYACDPGEVEGMINLDFDEVGALVGIEVLDASRKLPAGLLKSAEKI